MPVRGHAAFNLRGQTHPVAGFLERIAQVAASLGLSRHVDLAIAADAPANPFVCDLDDRRIGAAFPGMPLSSLDDGIRSSLQTFIAVARSGPLELDPS